MGSPDPDFVPVLSGPGIAQVRETRADFEKRPMSAVALSSDVRSGASARKSGGDHEKRGDPPPKRARALSEGRRHLRSRALPPSDAARAFIRMTQCVRRFVLLQFRAFPEMKRLFFSVSAVIGAGESRAALKPVGSERQRVGSSDTISVPVSPRSRSSGVRETRPFSRSRPMKPVAPRPENRGMIRENAQPRLQSGLARFSTELRLRAPSGCPGKLRAQFERFADGNPNWPVDASAKCKLAQMALTRAPRGASGSKRLHVGQFHMQP
jgi:hypothetical protein